MSIEDKLKEYILTRYDSISEFSKVCDIAPTTIYSMLKRGLENSSVSMVIKVCKALNLSTDALADNRIEKISTHFNESVIDIYEPLNDLREYVNKGGSFTIKGDPISHEEMEMLLSSVEVIIELAKKKHSEKS